MADGLGQRVFCGQFARSANPSKHFDPAQAHDRDVGFPGPGTGACPGLGAGDA